MEAIAAVAVGVVVVSCRHILCVIQMANCCGKINVNLRLFINFMLLAKNKRSKLVFLLVF